MQAWPAHLHGERDGARPRAVKKMRTAEQSEMKQKARPAERRAARARAAAQAPPAEAATAAMGGELSERRAAAASRAKLLCGAECSWL